MRGAFRIIFVRLGVAEQGQKFVPRRSDDGSSHVGDCGGARLLENLDDAREIFRVDAGYKFG
jgi:hypothetical protein